MSGHGGAGGGFGLVHGEVVGDGQVGAGVGGAVAVELVDQAGQGTAVGGGVGRLEGDLDAVLGGVDVAGQLGEGAQQITDIVAVGVVGHEPVEEPLLGVVGADLDAVDDVFVFELHDLAGLVELGHGDMFGQGLAFGDQAGDVVLEVAELFDGTLLGDLEPVAGAAVVSGFVE